MISCLFRRRRGAAGAISVFFFNKMIVLATNPVGFYVAANYRFRPVLIFVGG